MRTAVSGGATCERTMPGFCRDCRRDVPERAARCSACGSPRLLRHAEIDALAIARVDCDAFYATIEKRDDPSLADKPGIVGGRQRGVVVTATYLARTAGARPAAGGAGSGWDGRRGCSRRGDCARTPASCGGTWRNPRAWGGKCASSCSSSRRWSSRCRSTRRSWICPAPRACMACRRPRHWRISPPGSRPRSASPCRSGLSCNKFLAKIASDLDQPRGFAGLRGGAAAAFLAPTAATLICGVGKMAQQRLAGDGLRTIGDLQRAGEIELRRRYGVEGARLARLARSLDDRPVKAEREAKSISAETTFDRDIADFRPLELRLCRLCEKVSARLKANALAGSTVTLKLKTAHFRTRPRPPPPTHP